MNGMGIIYSVFVTRTVRERYEVYADSEEEAREKWAGDSAEPVEEIESSYEVTLVEAMEL